MTNTKKEGPDPKHQQRKNLDPKHKKVKVWIQQHKNKKMKVRMITNNMRSERVEHLVKGERRHFHKASSTLVKDGGTLFLKNNVHHP